MVETPSSMYPNGTDDLLSLDKFLTEELLELSPSQCSNETLSIDSQIFSNLDSQELTRYIQSPEHLRQLPIFEDLIDNEWKFDMKHSGSSGNKSSWMFSEQMNKVFVKINQPLNVYPKFNRHDPNVVLFIRAMVVYSSQNDLPEPVRKCPNHKEQSSSTDHSDHILLCDNAGTIYVGTENGKLFEERLAVLVPMHNVASNEPLKLTFTCQNSCSGGMNRKSTSIIFTLEDNYGNILGRKKMHFKVCSCPRRDKEKDEQATNSQKELQKKRKNDGSNGPSTSKKMHLMPKQDSTDSIPAFMEQTVTDLGGGNFMAIKQEQCELRLLLPNEELRREVLHATYNIIAGAMTRNANPAYKQYLIDIQKQIDENPIL